MARKFPKEFNPAEKLGKIEEILKKPNNLYEQDKQINLDINFISPYFGGGAEAGKNDNKKLIRETSIRGQLRFWWRATVGAKNSVDEMKKREKQIFGSTEQASRVIIKVINISNIVEYKSYEKYTDRNNREKEKSKNSYVLFPFRETKSIPSKPQIDGKQNLLFTLNITIKGMKKTEYEQENKPITVSQINNELETALKAWINFGGLGARTRRGLGSLYCKDYSFANIEEIKKFFQENKSQNTDFPTINKIFYKKSDGNGEDWIKATDLLKDFRQGISIGRRKGQGLDSRNRPKKYGRTYWPEPDTIGSMIWRLKENEQHNHKNRLVYENAFPRAEFGLPIIIDFRNDLEPPRLQIVPVVEENGKEVVKERFSSPLIIKSMKLTDGMYQTIILLNGKNLIKKVKLDLLITKKEEEKIKIELNKIISSELSNNRTETAVIETNRICKEIVRLLNEETINKTTLLNNLELLNKKTADRRLDKKTAKKLNEIKLQLLQKILDKKYEQSPDDYDIKWKPQSFQNNGTSLTKNGSAVEGFMEFIKKNGFKEINGGIN